MSERFALFGMMRHKPGIFSVIDVVEVLTESTNPRNYWKVLKTD